MIANIPTKIKSQVFALTFLITQLCAGGLANHPTDTANIADSGPYPKLVNTCLITAKVGQLATFYEHVLGIKAKKSDDDYVEFLTDGGVLAIFSQKAQEKYIPSSAEAAKNESVILEFQVSNVDREYSRIKNLVQVWVKLPNNAPWGTRSMYFRDPDGNLIDFYQQLN